MLTDKEAKDYLVTTYLSKDGWYYTNTGYRFHAESDGEIFIRVWDLEEIK